MSGATRLAVLISTVLAVAGFRGSAKQMPVPAAASLDVQVVSAPMPVRIGGRYHLAYELHVTNFRSTDVALTSVDVLGDASGNAPLASYRDAALRTSLARAGAPRGAPDPHLLASGARAVMFIWLPLEEGTPVPEMLHHRISFELVAAHGREPGTIDAGRISVGRERPIALDRPLRSGPWVAVYDPSSAGGHRRALFAVDGRARIPARFAVDWVKLTEDHGYGAEVLAVADATVVGLADRFPEPTTPITLDSAAGNYVTLDLGAGRFAFYEHLRPGSVRVKLGERVRSGQGIASLGASGSVSSGAHLHFHVADTNSPLGAEGLPYVFKHFEALGAFPSLDAFAKGEAWVPSPSDRRMELPREQTVLRF